MRMLFHGDFYALLANLGDDNRAGLCGEGFVQESLRLLACNALLGTLLFADFFAFISPTKVQKNPKYASKIMFIFLIFNSFYERQMRSDN